MDKPKQCDWVAKEIRTDGDTVHVHCQLKLGHNGVGHKPPQECNRPQPKLGPWFRVKNVLR